MIEKHTRFLDSIPSHELGEEIERVGGQLISVSFSVPKNVLDDIRKHPSYEPLQAAGLGNITTLGYQAYRFLDDVVDITTFSFRSALDPLVRYICKQGSQTPEIMDEILKRMLKKNMQKYGVSKGMHDRRTQQSIFDYANIQGIDRLDLFNQIYNGTFDNLVDVLDKILNKRFEEELLR